MWTQNSLAAALLCSAAQTAFAENIYVDASAPSTPPGNGSSWQSAFNDLQAAIAIAKPGDEIRIAQGVYKPAPPGGSREATFNLVDGVTIQGGYAGLAGDDPDALDHEKYPTILSGDLNGDDPVDPTELFTFPTFQPHSALSENSYQVITSDGVGPKTSVRGVTIQGGFSDYPSLAFHPLTVGGGITCLNSDALTLVDCVLRRNSAWVAGGAIYCNAGELQLLRCRFIENFAYKLTLGSGGAIYATGDVQLHALDCIFQGNRAGNVGGAVIGGPAGGAQFERCDFISNYALEAAGAISAGSSGGLIMIDCRIHGNATSHWIGGVYAANARIINCSFIGNSAAPYLMIPGTALRVHTNSQIVNCLFANNGSGTAVIGCDAGSHAIINCTIADNMTANGPSAINVGGGQWGQTNVGELFMANTIIWNNTTFYSPSTSVPLEVNGAATIHNSIIQNWSGSLPNVTGTGNSAANPRFVDPENGDYRLRANSQAIDTGSDAALPKDIFDLNANGNTFEPIPFDLDWLTRIANSAVDRGAYELQDKPCRGDVNGDLAVNVDDLLMTLDTWGNCVVGESGGCDADFNLDGSVDVSDLIFLLAGWGACP